MNSRQEELVYKRRRYFYYMPGIDDVITNKEKEAAKKIYTDYLTQEVLDRTKRHVPVLRLLGIGLEEEINISIERYVDYVINGNYLFTSRTPANEAWFARNDKSPFFREIKLPDGRQLEIEDDSFGPRSPIQEYVENHCDNIFSTHVSIYKANDIMSPSCEKTILLSDGKATRCKDITLSQNNEETSKVKSWDRERETYINYTVDAYDKPVSLTVVHEGTRVYLSKSLTSFSYSDRYRERKLSFTISDNKEDPFLAAEYYEGIQIDGALKGKICVERSLIEKSYTYDYHMSEEFDGIQELPSTKINSKCASAFSKAIVTHERSKETALFVLKVLYARFPELEAFLLDKFPNVLSLLQIDKFCVPGIERMFDKISNPLLAFGENGFAFEDPREIQDIIRKKEEREEREFQRYFRRKQQSRIDKEKYRRKKQEEKERERTATEEQR